MLGMKNHFDKSGSIEIREVDIAGVACIGIYQHVRLEIYIIIWWNYMQTTLTRIHYTLPVF